MRQTAQPAAPAGQEQLRQPAGAAACLWHGFNSFWPASRVRGASSGLKPKSCPRCTDTRRCCGCGHTAGPCRGCIQGDGARLVHDNTPGTSSPYLSTLQSRKEAAINPQDSLMPLLYLCTHACKWADPPRVDSQLLDHNADLFLLLFLMVRDKLSSRNSSPRFWGFSGSTLLAPAQPEGFRKGLWNNAGNVSVWEGGGRF